MKSSQNELVVRFKGRNSFKKGLLLSLTTGHCLDTDAEELPYRKEEEKTQVTKIYHRVTVYL